MPTIYNQIQPLSFRLRTDTAIPLTYDELTIPDEYKDELLSVYQLHKQNAKNLPVDDLNRLIRLLVPDLYSISPYGGQIGREWLRAEHKSIEAEKIHKLVVEWRNIHGMSNVNLPVDIFQWMSVDIDLADWTTHENNTAKASKDAIYDILPALLARKIEGQSLDLGGANSLTFYRVSKSPVEKGHEMMSWPPLIHKDDKNRSWYYSYYLRISVATIPFDSQPVINVYVGIRRWISQYHSFLPRTQHSVYLRTKVSYIKSPTRHHAFQVAYASLGKDFNLEWDDNLPQILKNVGVTDTILTPQELRENPCQFLESHEKPNMALVYHTRMGSPTHAVNLGITSYDRVKILEKVTQLWEGLLVLKPTIPRATVSKIKNEQVFSNNKISNTISKRWGRLKQQHPGGYIHIEVYYQQEETRLAMLGIIADMLGIAAHEDKYTRDDFTVVISSRLLGKIGSALERNATDKIHDVVESRRAMVLELLGLAQNPTIALIELGNADEFKEFNTGKKSTDPKNTLRAAFASSGRLSQFFTPMTSKEIKGKKSAILDRFKNAVLDGLRQLGVHEAGYINKNNDWELNPNNYSVAGFWLIRQSGKVSQSNRQRFLPTIVYINHQNGQVLAWAQGLDRMYPYYQVLLMAGQGRIDISNTQDHVAKRLPQDIQNQLMGDSDVILAVDVSEAGMRNRVWGWLQDKNIIPDHVTFNHNSAVWTPEDIKQLRIVRVRNAEDEIPTWYAVENDNAGISKGLWQVSERVFGSTVGSPSTQKFNRRHTKTDPDKASTNTPNPSFYEFTAAFIQPGDDAATIVNVLHSLRDASVQSRDETAHTLPLHFAKQIEEYFLWVDEDENLGANR